MLTLQNLPKLFALGLLYLCEEFWKISQSYKKRRFSNQKRIVIVVWDTTISLITRILPICEWLQPFRHYTLTYCTFDTHVYLLSMNSIFVKHKMTFLEYSYLTAVLSSLSASGSTIITLWLGVVVRAWHWHRPTGQMQVKYSCGSN